MEEEFKNIVNNCNRILYKVSRSYTQTDDDFKDLYQEILVQLWRSYPSFKGASKLSTWTYRVALNTAITFNNKQKSIRTKSLDTTVYEIPDGEEKVISNDRSNRNNKLLYCCINKLKKDERAIILLYLENNSYEEIAEILGIKINLVGVKIHRIKKKLLSSLKKSGYERF